MSLAADNGATPSGPSLRRELLVACVAVIAALAASFGAYLGAQEVEESKTATAARGTARVLQARFSSVDIRLRYMLGHDRLVARDDTFVIDLPIDDEELIASNVSADEWERVVTGMEALRLVLSLDTVSFQRADAHLLIPLDPYLRGVVKRTHRAIARADVALASLSGISSEA